MLGVDILTSLASTYSYPALTIAAAVSQPTAALAAGVLAKLNIVQFGVAFGIIFAVDMCFDVLWYTLGMRHGERVARFLSHRFHVVEGDLTRIQTLFRTRSALILISAKLLGGFGMMPLILFTAGTSKIPFRYYMTLNALGEIPWTGGLMLTGFFFSSIVGQVQNVLGKGLLILSFALLIALGMYAMRVAKDRLLKSS